MPAPIKVLIVEDLATDAELALHELKKAGIDYTAAQVQTRTEFLSCLETFAPDVILCDYTMPHFDGMEALGLARRQAPDTPFIFVSGTIGEEVAIESLKRGAVDYVLKTNLKRLGPTVKRAIQDVRERSARLIAERHLNEARIRFELFMHNLPGSAFIKDWRGRYQFVNAAWEEIHGRKMTEVLGRTDASLWPELAAQFENSEQLVLDKKDVLRSIETFPRPDGLHQYMLHRFPIRDHGGQLTLVGGIAIDLTDRMQLEAKLQESEAGLRRAQHMTMLAHVVTGPDGSFESWSDTLPRLIGIAPDQMPKKTCEWLKILHPEDRAKFREKSVEAGVSGARVDVAYRLRRDDSSWVQIRQVMEPLQGQADANGKMRWFSTLQDVTEQKTAQEKIERLNRVYAVLSGINALIVRVRDRQELFSEACRIAVEDGGFGTAWIGAFDPSTQEITPMAWAGIDAQTIASSKRNTRSDSPQGRGTASRAIREKKAVFSNDLMSEPDTGGEGRREAIARGYRSLISLPLLVDGDAVGNLSLIAKEGDFFNDEETKLLSELAGDISFALEHIGKEEKIKRLSRVQAVTSEINSLIVRVRDRQELFDEACRIAVSHGKFDTAWIGTFDSEMLKVTPVAWADAAAQNLFQTQGASQIDVAKSPDVVSQAIRERRPVFNNDIALDPAVRSARRLEAIREGYHSLIALPFMVEGAVIGHLSLYSKEANFFNEDEVKLLAELAGNISFALEHLDKQEKLNHLAYYDTLTGLPNRTLFHDRVTQAVQSAKQHGGKVAVLLGDIKRFRLVNDAVGRHAGDTLLRELASRLKLVWPEPDNVARISGDCFAGMLSSVKEESEIAHLLEQPIVDALIPPFQIGGKEIGVSLTAGIAVFPSDGEDADTLLKNAEAALKKAKAGGEKYLFYHAKMNAAVSETLRLENNLRRAIDNEEFVLHYQPKLHLASGNISGLEALIRWNDPESGLVPPVKFIPLLEETGMIVDVGIWAIRKALHDYREWHIQGLQPPRIAVNVSSIQLRQKNFVDVVGKVIKDSRAMPHGLDLEITESLIMEDIEGNIKKLKALRDMGINIAIDDFGTGYSSLGYLARLPVNLLKIDRSFINNMTRDPDSMTIVSTIISLAHSLKLKVVAEGVETEEQSRFLKLLKCDEMQGYLFSKPLPFEQLTKMLENHRERLPA